MQRTRFDGFQLLKERKMEVRFDSHKTNVHYWHTEVTWSMLVLESLFVLSGAMIRENRQLVTNEPVAVQDCRKDYFRGIYNRIYPNWIKENQRMSTCNRLDLQARGSQPVMPKNLPHHWSGWEAEVGCEPTKLRHEMRGPDIACCREVVSQVLSLWEVSP